MKNAADNDADGLRYSSNSNEDGTKAELNVEETTGNREHNSVVQIEEPEVSKDKMLYTINDVPPWHLCIILGFQQLLTMMGATVALAQVLGPALCVRPEETVVTSEILGTLFFASGLFTLIQTTIGTRLPIVQGGTFAFLVSSMAILSLDKWKCPTSQGKMTSVDDVISGNGSDNSSADENNGSGAWRSRMLEIQGAIILASLFEVVIGVTGLIGLMIRFISPLTIASCISLVGLSLYKTAAFTCSGNWWIAFMTISLIALFSQYLRNVSIPCCTIKDRKCVRSSFPLFRLFPIIMAVAISWFICFLLTITDAIPNNPQHWAYLTRTDVKNDVLSEASWFRIPYPLQWGKPTFSAASVFGMVPAVLAGIVESVGDYYACARISCGPVPKTHVINRGIFMEGILCVMAGLFGSGTGSTSYSENVGAIGVTKAASRRIIQVGAIIMILCGTLGKFGALFVTIPPPVIGGLFVVMFGMITSVGISNLQFVDLSSTRNMFIFGLSIILGLGLPDWLESHPGVINTGDEILDQILTVLGKTSMFIGGGLSMVLDGTIPGSDEERGIKSWRGQLESNNDSAESTDSTYDLPFGMSYIRRWNWTKYVPICPTFSGFGIYWSSFAKRKSKQIDDNDKPVHDNGTAGNENRPNIISTTKL